MSGKEKDFAKKPAMNEIIIIREPLIFQKPTIRQEVMLPGEYSIQGNILTSVKMIQWYLLARIT